MIPSENAQYDLYSMMRDQIQFGSVGTMSTPAKIAALVFGLVLLIPVLALLLVAGVVSTFVFGTLLLIGLINTKVRSLTCRDRQGRKNVRVKR
jgi:uncharacterized membrane protein HdeD (DUF308 family)